MVTLRKAKHTDLKQVANIYNEYLGKSTMDLETAVPSNYEKLLTAGRERLFMAEVNRKAVGWALIKKYSDRIGYARSCETSVYLTKDETGKGYGPKIKNQLIDECAKLGYSHLVAKIMSVNKTSINYNLKLGYEIVGEQKNIGYINGKYHNVTIMQYNIINRIAP